MKSNKGERESTGPWGGFPFLPSFLPCATTPRPPSLLADGHHEPFLRRHRRPISSPPSSSCLWQLIRGEGTAGEEESTAESPTWKGPLDVLSAIITPLLAHQVPVLLPPPCDAPAAAYNVTSCRASLSNRPPSHVLPPTRRAAFDCRGPPRWAAPSSSLIWAKAHQEGFA